MSISEQENGTFHFQQEENEKLQKSETCIFEDVGTLTKINV